MKVTITQRAYQTQRQKLWNTNVELVDTTEGYTKTGGAFKQARSMRRRDNDNRRSGATQ